VDSSTHKKVVVLHRLPGSGSETTPGFISTAELTGAGRLNLLSPEGQARRIEWEEVQAVFFVSGFERIEELRGDLRGPHHGGNAGARRPGLWVRVRCRDHWSVEGILDSDLLDLGSGISLSPLHAHSSCQRIYVPRSAAERVSVVDWVRPARQRRTPGPAAADQFTLFEREKEEQAP